MPSSIFDISSMADTFEQVNLNREQTSKILREHIAKHEQLKNPDYGFRIRFAHVKLLNQALEGSLDQIINMKNERHFGKGKFFQLKEKASQEESSQEDLKMGEDFHNPIYDSKMVHPLGRFN